MRKLMTALFAMIAVLTFAQPLPSDNTYRTGRLSNGMTYYIRHNAKEAGIADFYIAQRVGSILEEPRQRGLAHFLEHMAFNGSQNFQGTAKSPSIVHWCEAHGIKFGANLNAYTSVDETVYPVSAVPGGSERVVDSPLLRLHDWSHYLNLTDKEIDKERGVIHEEWRSRRAGMATQRMMESALPIVYKGSKYEDCLPIGSMDIVDNFPYKDLRDYYHKWYRPDLQAIIVVGDIDVDKMEQKVRTLFSKIPKAANPARRIYYPVPDNEQMIVCSLKDAEQPIMLVNLYMKRNATPDSLKNNVQYERDNYIDALIQRIVNNRLDEMQNTTPKPCLSASARLGQFFISRTKDAFTLSFGARQENIKGSFDAAIGVVEQLRQHGITQSELDRAKAYQRSVAERVYNNRSDRKNSYYVRKAQNNFLDAEPLISDEEAKQLSDEFGRSVTLEDVNNAVRETITDHNQVLVVYAPDKPDFNIPSNDELKGYILAAQAKTYAPYKDNVVNMPLIEKEPKAGSIVKEQPSIDGTTLLTLSNGIKVYYKQTDFSKDNVAIHLWGEGGTSLYPAEDAPNFRFLTSAITKAGVGNLDEAALSKVLTGKTIRLTPSVGDGKQSISGSSSIKDARTLFQLTWLYFTQPRYDKKAFDSELDRMRSFLTNREASPNVSYNDTITKAVYGDNLRTAPLKLKDLRRVSYDRIYEIYKDRFADATGFRMTVIGNLSPDSLRPLLEKYIASLPAKGRKNVAADTYPAIIGGVHNHEWTRETATPQSKVTVLYTWQEKLTAKNDLALDALRRVLSIAYTDSVREEQGGVYGISAQAGIDPDNKPTGLLKLTFTTGPGKYQTVMPVVLRQLENIAKHGPLAESLEKVKAYLKKQYGQAVVTNDYWKYVIENNIEHGVDFDKDYLKLVDSLSGKDVQQMARHILDSHRRITVTMHSVKRE